MIRTAALVTLIFTLVGCGGGGGGGSTPPPPPTNQAPVAADQSVGTDPGVARVGQLSASDGNGDALTYSIVANPASGSVAVSGTGNRDFEYTPNGGFVGTDSFTFNANDGTTNSNTATVTVFVNFAPVVNSLSLKTSDIADIAGTVTATDAEGDAVTFDITTSPTKGTVSSFDSSTGEFVYTPDADQDGVDTFEVSATDMFRTSQSAIVDVEIFGWVGSGLSGGADIDYATTDGLLLLDDGGFIFGGGTDGSFAGDTSAGDRDAWIRRIDRRGMEVWTQQFGDALTNDARSILKRPQNDGFYVVSSPQLTPIVRMDFDGNTIWSMPIDFGGRELLVAGYWNNVDDNGDLVVLSWFWDRSISPTSINGLVSKIKGDDGSMIWERELLSSVLDPLSSFADTQYVQPRGVDFDSTGQIIIAGSIRSTAIPLSCNSCPFIAMLDPTDGSDIWLREPATFDACGLGTEGRFYRVVVDADDTIIVNGHTPTTNSDALLARFNADATSEEWSICEDTPDQADWTFTAPVILADGSILSATTLRALESSTLDLLFSSAKIAKYSSDGVVQTTSVFTPLRADGSEAITQAGSIIEDSQGLWYLTGATDGDLNGQTNSGADDAFIERFDADGNPAP